MAGTTYCMCDSCCVLNVTYFDESCLYGGAAVVDLTHVDAVSHTATDVKPETNHVSTLQQDTDHLRLLKPNEITFIYKPHIHRRNIQDSCKTSNDVRCRDLGSEESTREEVGCGGNEDVKMDEWSHQAGQN